MSSFKQVCVIGLGYIGLPMAAVLASRGLNVHGVDINAKVVDTINQGKIHIVEPELDILVAGAVASGRFKAALIPSQADVFIIAVPTPFKGDYEPDVSYVEAAAKAIAPFLQKGNLVILESTSPVDTTAKLAIWLQNLRPDLTFPHDYDDQSDIQVAYCPERVLPGHIIKEVVENDRVIGGISQSCTERAYEFYKLFVQGKCLKTNARTAAMTKLVENAFRDVNIAFANELSLLCGELNINVWELIALANHHPRVNILQPGPGVGGHCIAVDPWFIVHNHPEHARLVRMAREVNDSKPKYVVDEVKRVCASIENPVVACLGLAFKPNIDDLRESPAVKITKNLAKQFKVLAVEPHISALPTELQNEKNIQLVDLHLAVARADVLVLLVKHDQFKQQDIFDTAKIILDFCGVQQHKNQAIQKVEC